MRPPLASTRVASRHRVLVVATPVPMARIAGPARSQPAPALAPASGGLDGLARAV